MPVTTVNGGSSKAVKTKQKVSTAKLSKQSSKLTKDNDDPVSVGQSSSDPSSGSSEARPSTVVNHSVVGHILKEGDIRSEDVCIEEEVDFADMYLKDEVLAGLHATGFHKPSPVQLQAIPTGRCGLDLIVQAKSGTGKTCVFTVLALEMVAAMATTTQVLVVAPTREIAVQIASVMTSVGRHISGLKVQTFIGGTSVEKPGVCHIAVGTPGRLHHLLSSGILCGQNIRLLVLDEADQLLESFRAVLQQMIASLPHSKQVICASATYTPSLQELAKKIMRSPVHVTLSTKQLLAVRQYVHQLPYTSTMNQAFRAKLLHLKGILGSVMFNQCLIFTNSIMKAESVSDSLKSSGWPVACLCGGQTQEQRLKALDELVTHKCRVLVCTDLAARGLDSPHVSLVISLEAPPHPHTYLHRVGRAGRFGSSGCSIVLAAQGDDWLHVRAIATVLDLSVWLLPEPSLEDADEKCTEVLKHLTSEQLQQWTETTSHKLSYAGKDGGGGGGNNVVDPLEIWKMKRREDSPVKVKDAIAGSVTDAVVVANGGQSAVEGAALKLNDPLVETSLVHEFEEVRDGEANEAKVNNEKLDSFESVKEELDSFESEKEVIESIDGDQHVESDFATSLVASNEQPAIGAAQECKAAVLDNATNDHSDVLNSLKAMLHRNNTVVPFSYKDLLDEMKSIEDTTSETANSTARVHSLPSALDTSADLNSQLRLLLDDSKVERERHLKSVDAEWAAAGLESRNALDMICQGQDPTALVKFRVEKLRQCQESRLEDQGGVCGTIEREEEDESPDKHQQHDEGTVESPDEHQQHDEATVETRDGHQPQEEATVKSAEDEQGDDFNFHIQAIIQEKELTKQDSNKKRVPENKRENADHSSMKLKMTSANRDNSTSSNGKHYEEDHGYDDYREMQSEEEVDEYGDPIPEKNRQKKKKFSSHSTRRNNDSRYTESNVYPPCNYCGNSPFSYDYYKHMCYEDYNDSNIYYDEHSLSNKKVANHSRHSLSKQNSRTRKHPKSFQPVVLLNVENRGSLNVAQVESRADKSLRASTRSKQRQAGKPQEAVAATEYDNDHSLSQKKSRYPSNANENKAKASKYPATKLSEKKKCDVTDCSCPVSSDSDFKEDHNYGGNEWDYYSSPYLDYYSNYYSNAYEYDINHDKYTTSHNHRSQPRKKNISGSTNPCHYQGMCPSSSYRASLQQFAAMDAMVRALSRATTTGLGQHSWLEGGMYGEPNGHDRRGYWGASGCAEDEHSRGGSSSRRHFGMANGHDREGYWGASSGRREGYNVHSDGRITRRRQGQETSAIRHRVRRSGHTTAHSTTNGPNSTTSPGGSAETSPDRDTGSGSSSKGHGKSLARTDRRPAKLVSAKDTSCKPKRRIHC